jgi:hypothetical protein
MGITRDTVHLRAVEETPEMNAGVFVLAVGVLPYLKRELREVSVD